ncbi:MAG: hypothetical protein OEV44_09195 [Spirochaetota bacterium]|nr:hypothetical protein [Spirochaetota bacterium]
MKKLLIIILLMITTLSSISFSEDGFRGYEKLECRLKVQKSNFELGEPIVVQFQVKNKDYNSVDIRLSEKSYYNFDFSIKSIKNRLISELENFYLEKVDSKTHDKNLKKITLDHEQFYGVSFDLTKYYNLDKPGYYVIQGHFTPIPRDVNRPSVSIATQIIQIEIKGSAYQEQIALESKINEENELQKIRNPYETVKFMLKARQEKNWVRYFRYIDLYQLIKEYPVYYKRYQDLKPSKRENIIHEFQEYLKEYLDKIGYNKIDQFSIYKSIVENEKKKAKIYAKITYKGEGLTFYRKYVFYLYQKNKRWFVMSWKVNN